MAKLVGRKVKITRTTTDGVVVSGVRTKNLTINNEEIDVTDDDDDGWRSLLNDSGMRSIDMSLEGVTKDSALIAAAASGTNLIAEYTVEIPTIGTFTGEFRIGNVQLGAPYNDAVTFTADMKSTGAQEFEAAA